MQNESPDSSDLLLGPPENSVPEVSPDGMRLAYLRYDSGTPNIWLGLLHSKTSEPITHFDSGVRFFDWAHDGRHILFIAQPEYGRDPRIGALDIETKEIVWISPVGSEARVLAISKHRPSYVVLGIRNAVSNLFDPYSFDLLSGRLSKLMRNPGFSDFLIDLELKVLGGVWNKPDGSKDFVYRRGDETWRSFFSCAAEDALLSYPVSILRRSGELLAISPRGRNTSALVRIGIHTGGLVDTIAADEGYDVRAEMIDPDNGEVRAVSYSDVRKKLVAIDPALKADLDFLNEFRDDEVSFIGRDHSDSLWLVGYEGNEPRAYYVLDRRAGTMLHVFSERPSSLRFSFFQSESFQFEARDGVIINGFLTKARNLSGSMGTVIKVHGGPWDRDTASFDPEVQWLVGLGFSCVRVNYRGSIGSGKEFLRQGYSNGGQHMIDDIVDAARFLMRSGFSQGGRIGLFGHSFGGTLALLAAADEGNLFSCIVAGMAPVNLVSFAEKWPPYWKHLLISGVNGREGELFNRSPLGRVNEIKIPVLFAYATKDVWVPVEEGEQFATMLRQRSVPTEVLEFQGGGHTLNNEMHIHRFAQAVRRFLSQHLSVVA